MVGGLPTSNCLLRKLCWRLTLLRTYTILHVVLFSWLGNHGFALHVLLRKVLKLQCLRHVSKISRSVMISWGATIIVAIRGSKKPIETMDGSFFHSNTISYFGVFDIYESTGSSRKGPGGSQGGRTVTQTCQGVILHLWPMMADDGLWWRMMAYVYV